MTDRYKTGPEAGEVCCENCVDIFMMMGQSNMAGRGDGISLKEAQSCLEAAGTQGRPSAAEADTVITGATVTAGEISTAGAMPLSDSVLPPQGMSAVFPEPEAGTAFEYRAVSAPGRLWPLREPFGCAENREGGIDDGDKKTGSMAAAFATAYYLGTGVPLVAVSASKGGSSILEWQPQTAYLEDARQRLRDCRAYLREAGIPLRHVYMLWCQGESDGDRGMSAGAYRTYFESMFGAMQEEGVEHCFLVRIGEYNGPKPDVSYTAIIEAQTRLLPENDRLTLVSTELAGMKQRGGMKDWFHFYQWVCNEVGFRAGMNTAAFVREGRAPALYDPYYGGIYLPRGEGEGNRSPIIPT